MKKYEKENKILKVLIAVCAAAVVALTVCISLLVINVDEAEPQTEETQYTQPKELVIIETNKRTEGFVTITTNTGKTVQYFGEVDIISDGSNGKQVDITIDGYCVEYCPHINPEEMERTE